MAAGKLLIFKETRDELDLNSARTRAVHRILFSTTETIEETWLSKALAAVGKRHGTPVWITVSSKRSTPFRTRVACSPGLPYDGPASMLNSFTDRFSPEALALVAEDILSMTRDRGRWDVEWRKYEAALLKLAMTAKDRASLDVQTVERIRSQFLNEAQVR